jgi:LysM repeat protein
MWLESRQGNYKSEEIFVKKILQNLLKYIKMSIFLRKRHQMRRFLDQKTDVTIQEHKELSMEDIARMNIRQKLLETALVAGISLVLTEQSPAKEPEDPLKPYMDTLKAEEGFKTRAYKDTKGIQTIGVGFNLTRPDTQKVFQACFGDQCGDVLTRARNPKAGMTEAEVERLTRYDLERTFLPRVKKLVPDFEKMPEATRSALLSSTWRGALPGSPKTLSLINAGKGNEAAAEYLRNKEYEEAKKSGSGVAGRMERDAEAIKLIGAPAPTPTPVSPATTKPVAPKEETPGGYEDYEVKKGDTLSGISKRTGRSVEAITKASSIKDPNKIGVGQKIRIPKG